MDDEAIRVAVALRLGIDPGSTHTCRCGANVDPSGVHNLVCRRTSGRAARHHALNDCIFRALGAAGIPASKEPSGLVRADGKRPDGCTLIILGVNQVATESRLSAIAGKSISDIVKCTRHQ